MWLTLSQRVGAKRRPMINSAKCETGWGDSPLTRALFETRVCHPCSAHFIRVDPKSELRLVSTPPGEGKRWPAPYSSIAARGGDGVQPEIAEHMRHQARGPENCCERRVADAEAAGVGAERRHHRALAVAGKAAPLHRSSPASTPRALGCR